MIASQLEMSPDGPRVSRIIAGLWRLAQWGYTDTELLDWIKSCVDRGVTTFDNASIYGGFSCEELFGNALALEPSLRDSIQLVTKFGILFPAERRPQYTIAHYNTSRREIISSAENSLKMMKTDRIDVLLIHRPDFIMDADEIAAAFMDLKRDGKVLHFGVSNFTTSQFDLIQSRLDFPLVTNQIEFSCLYLDPLTDGTLDQCQKLRISPMIWSPLAGGRLFTEDDERTQNVRAALKKLADELNAASIDEVAIAWILMHPANPSIITGTGKIERIQSAINAEQLKLTPEQWYSVWVASTGHGVP